MAGWERGGGIGMQGNREEVESAGLRGLKRDGERRGWSREENMS